MNQNPPVKATSDIPPVASKAIINWKEILELLIIAIVYWILVHIGLLLVTRPEGIAAIWPVSGFALAILLLRPKNRWPLLLSVIFFTNAIGNWSFGNPLLVSLGYALANTIEPALCAWVMLTLCKSKITFVTTREILVLFFVGVAVNALTALLGALISTLAFHSIFLKAWYVWWVSDGLGIILITPFILSWTSQKRVFSSITIRQIVETSFLVIIMAVFAWLLYGPFTIAEKPLLNNYMFFPLFIWLAFLLGPRGVARVLLLIAIIATWNTLRGYGIFSFASQDQAEHLVSLQIFLVVETFSALILSTIIAERRKSEAQTETALTALRKSEGKYLNIFNDAPVGIFQSTPQGQFTLVNPATAHIYGFESSAEMIASITDISTQIYVNPSDRLGFQQSFAQNGNLFENIRQNYRKDGSIIWTQTTTRTVKDSLGNIQFYEGFITDITKRVQAETVLKESEKQFRVMFEKSSIGYTLTSIDGEYINVNQAFADMLGYSVDELVGKNWADITVPAYITPNHEILKPILTGQRNSANYEKQYVCKDGSTKEVFISTTLLRDEQKDPRFFITNIIDITERKQAELQKEEALEKLHYRENLLNETQLLSKVGGWEWDNIKQEMTWTDETYRIHEFEPVHEIKDSKEYINKSLSCYDPEDQSMVITTYQRCVDFGESYDLEIPFTTAKGRRLWVRTLAHAVQKNGRIVKVIGNIIDITERKQAELEREAVLEALRVSEQQFKLVSELTSDYIYKIGVSAEGKVTLDYVTDSYYAATGRDINKTRTFEQWVEIFHPDDLGKAVVFLQNLIATHQPGKLECRTFRANNEMRWIEIVARPDWNERENRVSAIIGAVKDITDRKQSEIKLQYLSLHDALTGLNNRAFFEESMEHLEHGRQYPISVLMVDVDRLKDTNDQFGHEAGDKLLKRAANVLVTAFRVEDVIARIGGDEFAVLLIGTSFPEAEAAMTRLRTIMDELNAASEGPELQLSCGLSTAEQGDSLIETLKAADTKMYQEKKRRNIEPK